MPVDTFHTFQKTYKFGIESYHVFATRQERHGWMVHFVWGKKDFRIWLDHAHGEGEQPGPVLESPDGERFVVRRLQYLNQFEWYDFDDVVGHGLHHDEVRWRKGRLKRYVELPGDFYDTAAAVACKVFGLERIQGPPLPEGQEVHPHSHPPLS